MQSMHCRLESMYANKQVETQCRKKPDYYQKQLALLSVTISASNIPISPKVQNIGIYLHGQHIEHGIPFLTYHSLHHKAPVYTTDLIKRYQPIRALESADSHRFAILLAG